MFNQPFKDLKLSLKITIFYNNSNYDNLQAEILKNPAQVIYLRTLHDYVDLTNN